MNKTVKFISILVATFILLSPGIILNFPPVDFLKKNEFSEKTLLFTSVVDVYSSLIHSLIYGLVSSLILYYYGYFFTFDKALYVLTALAFFLTPGLILNLPPVGFLNKGKKSFKENKILFTNKSDLLSSLLHGIIIVLVIFYLKYIKYIKINL